MKTIVISLVLILGISIQVFAENGAIEFKGFTLGQPVPEGKIKNCEKMAEVGSLCTYSDTIAGTKSRYFVFTVPKDGAEVVFNIIVKFPRSKNSPYDAVRMVLVQKYGKPFFEEDDSLGNNWFKSAQWRDGKSRIVLKERLVTLDFIIASRPLNELYTSLKKKADDL